MIMAAVIGFGLFVSACGSSTPSSGGPATTAPVASPTASPSTRPSEKKAECTSEAILAALPGGATMVEFGCADAGDVEWAAARTNPGDTLFFLRWDERRWKAEEADAVCGTASAGIPEALLDYCPVPSPSPSPTAAKACTYQSILAALPTGADLVTFTCANVSGTKWAAAQTQPGDTVFFLQWNGSQWSAQDSDSVCGAASAGLPESLLAFCRAPSPSPSADKACTSKSLVAALPNGATLVKFTCADVGGTRWAAARANPGDTVFFLQWTGSQWTAQDSDSVCGTAAAGLPKKLLDYCT
jgi:hypothetical protein